MKTIVMSLAFGVLLCGLTSCDTYVDGGYAVARPYGYAPSFYSSSYHPSAFYSSRPYYPSSYWGSGSYSRSYAYPSRYYSTRYLAPSSPTRYVAANAAVRARAASVANARIRARVDRDDVVRVGGVPFHTGWYR